MVILERMNERKKYFIENSGDIHDIELIITYIYSDFERTNYQTRRYNNNIKCWVKIIFKPGNKLVTMVYNQIKSDFECDDSTINWVVLMRMLLCDIGFHKVRFQQGVGDVGIFLSLLKQRVLDHFRQSWHNELQDTCSVHTVNNLCNVILPL